MPLVMILVDAHVHLYECYDLSEFLTSARTNFSREACRRKHNANFSAFLLLTDAANQNSFNRLTHYATSQKQVGNYLIKITPDKNTLLATHIIDDGRLYLVAGRQIVTAEKLEVLALFTNTNFKEGAPLAQTVKLIEKKGGIPVIPWGTGKWLGKRGKILTEFISKYQNNIFLGDNGGRPTFWPTPSHFKYARRIGMQILPGSDPLPFSTESKRAGSFGFTLNTSVNDKYPSENLKKALGKKDVVIKPYGKLESPLHFFRNQIAMQIVKRLKNNS